MPIINEVNEVFHKIEAKLYPNYLGQMAYNVFYAKCSANIAKKLISL